MRLIGIILLVMFTCLSANLDMPAGSVYLEGDTNKAVILVHGKGKHPTWKVVDPLRKDIHNKLGYHTLSLQMPNEDKNFKKYVDDFPKAYEIIKEAISFLQAKNIDTIYLLGHSMGSRMASAFIAENTDTAINGLVIIGCRNNGGGVLSCSNNVEMIDIPVLDIYGTKNKKDTKAASKREQFISETYLQKELSGANHKFDGYEDQLADIVIEWLEKQ